MLRALNDMHVRCVSVGKTPGPFATIINHRNQAPKGDDRHVSRCFQDILHMTIMVCRVSGATVVTINRVVYWISINSSIYRKYTGYCCVLDMTENIRYPSTLLEHDSA